MRIGIVIEYDGTEFSGWQVQPGQRTLQGALEQALGTVLGHVVRVEAAGRTDTGVHAVGQVCAFTTPREPDLRALQRSVNALAGRSIVVRELRQVDEGFDPRRQARRRSYEYRIDNRPWPSPFTERYAWHVHTPLDVAAMNRGAAALVGEHDFTSFRAAGCDARGPVRRVFESSIVTRGDELVYAISGTAFLRHMVRAIVGTLVEVGRGEKRPDDFAALLAAKDRTLAGATAPAHGLCLVAVEYAGSPFR